MWQEYYLMFPNHTLDFSRFIKNKIAMKGLCLFMSLSP